ncbi:MAG: DUF4230 domain-containing protein [Phaeodactylibacter sp.]|nr:DUF4230 domain-containing protein [Phaeodactylibacter sp.]
MKRTIWIVISLSAIFVLGFFVARSFYLPQPGDPKEESQILVEKIEKVCKLVTVEGHFVEYYDYEDPDRGTFFSYPYIVNPYALLPKRTARLRVNGKVLVGYDLKDMRIDADEATRTIRISNVPEPDVLALEHDIQYLDKTDNIFYRFSDEEIVRLTEGAKRKVRDAALGSELIKSAKEQGNDLFDLIEFMVTNAGWTFELEGVTPSADANETLWDTIQ